MNKIKIADIFKIIKDIFTKACVYFSILVIGITAICRILFLNEEVFAPGLCLMFALTALGAGIAVQIFKIKKMPAVTRHIAFFILLYLDFWLVFIPLSKYSLNPNSTFYLSIIFIVLYLVVLGVFMGIKAVVNSIKNSKTNYDKQFKNADVK